MVRPFDSKFFEQYPDGVYGVPLIFGEDPKTIGSAMVTFKDGLWSATLQLTDEGAKELGLELTFETVTGMVHDKAALLVKAHDIDFMYELKKRLG